MKKRFVRSRKLLLVAALAATTTMCTVSAAHASPAVGAVATRAVTSNAAAASNAPCNINYQSTTCQSTNPTVAVDVYYYGDTSDCTFVWSVDWGDGQSTANITNTDPSDGYLVLADHTYAGAKTYTISVTGQVTAGDCTLSPLTAQFRLLPSPTVYWSRTSGRPGTPVALTGNGWIPGGTVQVHLPSTGFFLGNSSWKVASNGSWKQNFRVADITTGRFTLSFTEASGSLRVTGSFRVLAEPNAGQDYSRCQNGACTIAVDHVRTQVLIEVLSGTPASLLYYEAGRLCLTYLAPIARYCAVFAAVIIIDKNLLAKQLSDSDQGHGVYITWLTVNLRKLPGVTPQK